MPRKYDPDTLTLFDLETGASVATIHVPDNGSFEEAHRIGYLMAAAEGMREALKNSTPHIEYYFQQTLSDVLRWQLTKNRAALRAAEPPR